MRFQEHDDVLELGQKEVRVVHERLRRGRLLPPVALRRPIRALPRVTARLEDGVVADRRRLREVPRLDAIEATEGSRRAGSDLARAVQNLTQERFAEHAELVEDGEVAVLHHVAQALHGRVAHLQRKKIERADAPSAVGGRGSVLHLEGRGARRRRQDARKPHALALPLLVPHASQQPFRALAAGTHERPNRRGLARAGTAGQDHAQRLRPAQPSKAPAFIQARVALLSLSLGDFVSEARPDVEFLEGATVALGSRTGFAPGSPALLQARVRRRVHVPHHEVPRVPARVHAGAVRVEAAGRGTE